MNLTTPLREPKYDHINENRASRRRGLLIIYTQSQTNETESKGNVIITCRVTIGVGRNTITHLFLVKNSTLVKTLKVLIIFTRSGISNADCTFVRIRKREKLVEQCYFKRCMVVSTEAGPIFQLRLVCDQHKQQASVSLSRLDFGKHEHSGNENEKTKPFG